MVDPDRSGFFVRWFRGTKDFASSNEGLLLSKLVFLGFAIIGLFMAGLLYWVGFYKNFWLGVVLVSFGFVSLIDWFKLLKLYSASVGMRGFFNGED